MLPCPRWPVSISLLLLALACGGGAEPLPRLAELPEFTLVDQDGQPFGHEQLRGKVSIASFMFTHCPTICPLLTERTKLLQDRFATSGGNLQIVSFSVDPRNDTPEVLRAYGQRHEVDTDIWTMVTGPTDEVGAVVARGFHLAMGEPEPRDDGAYDILHSSRFVLIDRQAVIRGYYDSDDQGMESLVSDAERLLR